MTNTYLATPAEFAMVLRVTPERVRQRLRAGEIRGMKVHGRWRVPLSPEGEWMLRATKEGRGANG